jgi:hypothetical protein
MTVPLLEALAGTCIEKTSRPTSGNSHEIFALKSKYVFI